MKAPNAYELVPNNVAETAATYITVKGGALMQNGDYWYPARPLGMSSISNRINLAWEVFTGRSDVIRWPAGQ